VELSGIETACPEARCESPSPPRTDPFLWQGLARQGVATSKVGNNGTAAERPPPASIARPACLHRRPSSRSFEQLAAAEYWPAWALRRCGVRRAVASACDSAGLTAIHLQADCHSAAGEGAGPFPAMAPRALCRRAALPLDWDQWLYRRNAGFRGGVSWAPAPGAQHSHFHGACRFKKCASVDLNRGAAWW